MCAEGGGKCPFFRTDCMSGEEGKLDSFGDSSLLCARLPDFIPEQNEGSNTKWVGANSWEGGSGNIWYLKVFGKIIQLELNIRILAGIHPDIHLKVNFIHPTCEITIIMVFGPNLLAFTLKVPCGYAICTWVIIIHWESSLAVGHTSGCVSAIPSLLPSPCSLKWHYWYF